VGGISVIASNKKNFTTKEKRLYKGIDYKVKKVRSGNKYPEIVGSVGTIVGWTDERECYFKIDNDVYKVPLKEIDPVPLSGLFKVNYSTVLSSDLLKGVSLRYGRETGEEIVKKLRTFGIMLPRVPEGVFDYVEIVTEKAIAHLGDFSFIKRGVIKSNGEVRYIPHYVCTDEKQTEIGLMFAYFTGKSLWDILKTHTYFEVPMCSCGSRHQLWEESVALGRVRLRCNGCNRIIYDADEDFLYELEDSIQELYEMNEPKEE
jgi:hypothetical protein